MGTASSFIHSDDETALLDGLPAPAAAALGLGGSRPPWSSRRRTAGIPPRCSRAWASPLSLEEAASSAVVRLRQHPGPAAAGRLHRPAHRPDGGGLDAQLAVLRGRPLPWRCRCAPPAAGPGSEEATQLGLETLLKAIRLKQRVVMKVVDGFGNASRETVVPVSVSGGRVRVFDADRETERVLSIHRIIDVEAAETDSEEHQ